MNKFNRISLIVFITFLYGCKRGNNDILFSKLKNEYSKERTDSKYFEYQYDGLTPQNNYFKNNKLHFLILHTGGEFVTSNYLILFAKNDSLKQQIVRKVTDKYTESQNIKDWNQITDTVVVYDYLNKKQTVYVAGTKINSKVNLNHFLVSDPYIYKIKSLTEAEYQKKLKK